MLSDIIEKRLVLNYQFFEWRLIETKYKHWCLINFFNCIKVKFIKGL